MTNTKDPRRALVSKLALAIGSAAADELDQLAQIHLLVHASGASAEAAASYRASIERVAEILGPALAEQYEACLREELAQLEAAQAARLARGRAWLERAEAGEPQVSSADIARVLKSSAGEELLQVLARGLDQGPEGQGATLDAAPPPPDDELEHLLRQRRHRQKPR